MKSAVASPVLVLLGVVLVAFVAAVLVAAWPAWSVTHRCGAARAARVTRDGRG